VALSMECHCDNGYRLQDEYLQKFESIAELEFVGRLELGLVMTEGFEPVAGPVPAV
jgi:hypothetical protein